MKFSLSFLQVWNEFMQRFGIKKIVEFYGATEGNANICKLKFYYSTGIQRKIYDYAKLTFD